jgi:hypothetical protein
VDCSGPEHSGLWRGLIGAAAPGFILSFVSAGACYLAAGPSLGAFLGAMVLAAVLTPPLILAEPTWLRRAVAGAAIVDGVAIVWLLAALHSQIGLLQWLGCYAVLAALVAGLMAMAAALRAARLPAACASALTVLVALAWLLWPIWTAPLLLSESAMGALVWAHPVFAINSIMLDTFPTWPAYSLAYHMTSLPSYAMPSGILPCVGAHVLVAAPLLWLAARYRVRPAD